MEEKMIDIVKRNLIIVYTITTSIILTIVFFSLYFIDRQQFELHNTENFRTQVELITSKLQTATEVKNSWLSELEQKNHMIIYIEDNQIALNPHASWKSIEEREKIIEQVKSENSLLWNLSSFVFHQEIKAVYNKKKEYYSAAIMIPYKNNWRSVIVVQYITKDKIIRQIIIFSLYLFGVIMLFFISYFFIGKTLEPVKHSKQQQNEFIAAASHELKSPLAVIRASNSAILKMPEHLREYTENIEKECMHMANLIDDMLLLASVDANCWSVKREVIEVDTIIIESYDAFLPIAKEKGLSLQLELKEEEFPPIFGDAIRLKQVLYILLDNAFCYAKGTEEICLCAYKEEKKWGKPEQIIIEVIDHGIGISKQQKLQVFQRFYQIEHRKQQRHYGLGLSIAKELVTFMGGTIHLNDTKGGGCTFLIALPVLKNV